MKRIKFEMENIPALLKATRRLDQAAMLDPLQADQIVGDVFSKYMDQLAVGKGLRKNLRSYLYQIACHLFIDQTRYSQRVAPIEIVELIATDKNSVQTEIENRAPLDTVMMAINNNLTEEQRHVVILRFLEKQQKLLARTQIV